VGLDEVTSSVLAGVGVNGANNGLDKGRVCLMLVVLKSLLASLGCLYGIAEVVIENYTTANSTAGLKSIGEGSLLTNITPTGLHARIFRCPL
jgi:hypothetical protein